MERVPHTKFPYKQLERVMHVPHLYRAGIREVKDFIEGERRLRSSLPIHLQGDTFYCLFEHINHWPAFDLSEARGTILLLQEKEPWEMVPQGFRWDNRLLEKKRSLPVRPPALWQRWIFSPFPTEDSIISWEKIKHSAWQDRTVGIKVTLKPGDPEKCTLLYVSPDKNPLRQV